MSEYIALKYYFDSELAKRLATSISEVYIDFPNERFINQVGLRTEEMELKERVAVITEELYEALPDKYEEAVSILLHILGPENLTEKGMFKYGYHLMPVAYFVERYGLTNVDMSMGAMYEITKRHTAEYAIRPYLTHHTQQTLQYLDEWINDGNSHVRRLVSEGTRPRLPWAKKIGYLQGDINQNFKILDVLKNDDSCYVRKSVGNHLNDLSKDAPDSVLSWLEDRNSSCHKEIMRKGLRTLIKNENERAVELLTKLE